MSNKAHYLAIFVALTILNTLPSYAKGTLMITEIMGSSSRILDENGNATDWIEIYNGTEKKINLKGYGLSDKRHKPHKWVFPDKEMGPGEYLVIFAPGKHKNGSQAVLCTNFGLSERDKGVYLFDSGGNLIDSITIEKLPKDISYGRNPIAGDIEYFPKPTPGKPNTTAAFSPIVEYSTGGGFYPSPISVRLYTKGGDSTIYYTTDGSTPTEASRVYSNPIKVDKNTAIRAVSLKKEHLISPPSGQDYFIDFDNKSMAIVAISTEEDNLWDPKSGLFRDVRYNDYMLRDKIRVHVSFFDENRNLRFSQDALMAVVGAGSRELMMRPLKLSANKEVDPMNSNFNHRLFYKDINAYRHFELRNNNQDGIRYVSDPASTPTMGIRNALFCALVHDQEGIELRYDNGPVLLFINGKNYGMMNMGEKRDNSGISGNNPKVNSEDIDLITVRDDMGFRVGRDKVGEGVVSIRNDGKVVYKGYFMDGALEYENISESARRSGSTAAIDDFLTIDPTDSGKMDPKSLIASMAAEAIACNTDFGMNNMSFWRSSPVGKSPEPFHALLFDFDQTFGLTEGEGDEGHDIMLDYEEKTKLFSQFLKKEEYKIAFIRKIDEFLNGPFRPENAIPIIDKLEKKMDPWIEYHLNMWTKGQMDKKRWKDNVQRIRKYVLARPEHVRKHLQDHFGFSGYSNMEFLVSPEKQGIIYMDTGVFNTPLEGKGTYANIPMKIFAKASIGHKFSHFLINGNNKISEQDYTLNPEDGMKVEAVFTEDSI